jgi:uncharacterized membrane protein
VNAKRNEKIDDLRPEPSRLSEALLRIRTNFLTGLVVAAPIALTIYLTWIFVAFVDNRVTPLIPELYRPPFTIPGLGVLIAFLALTILGMATKNLFGRSIIRASQRLFSRMPVVRSIYGAFKQIFETVVAESSSNFQKVGLIEYPRKGLWAIVFITTDTSGEITEHADADMVSVFLPTTPNPTSGYLLFVPKTEIIILEMTVEEAAKLIVSAGIVEPERAGRPVGPLDQPDIEEARRRIEAHHGSANDRAPANEPTEDEPDKVA